MKCKDCSLFTNKKDENKNYICNLCVGTYVIENEKDSKICKYTNEKITEEYASLKYWLNPIERFDSKISEIKEMLDFKATIENKNERISNLLIIMLYSQLVSSLEVFLKDHFKLGLQSEKGYENFVKRYNWKKKYSPNQLFKNIKNIVEKETNQINFQNFYECGKVYKNAFEIDIFQFPDKLKQNINRILRYRHGIVHKDEIWENGKFIKLSSKLIQQDIDYTVDFVNQINSEFKSKIGIPSEIKWLRVEVEHLNDNREINNCEKCPLGQHFDKDFIICFEGAYDGIGFGIEKEKWSNPICGGMLFKEAMQQRKALGEHALFGQIHFIPVKDKSKKKRKTK